MNGLAVSKIFVLPFKRRSTNASPRVEMRTNYYKHTSVVQVRCLVTAWRHVFCTCFAASVIAQVSLSVVTVATVLICMHLTAICSLY